MIKLVLLTLFLLVVNSWCAGKIVNLKVVTTGCRSSCWHYHDSKCPSSINVNGQEMAYRKDGFNIVVLDTNTGIVSKRKHIRWYNNLWFGTKSDFRDFFRGIQYNSTVVMTFQNMCKNYNENWYTYLSGLNHSIRKKYYSYQAIVIACKGPCPRAAEPYTNIPYTYYSSASRFSKSVTLLFGNAKAPPAKQRKLSKTASDGGSIVVIGGVIGGAILVFTVLYAGYMYCHRRNEHHSAYNPGTFNTVPSNTICEPRVTPDGPIYEELQLQQPQNGSNENPYQSLPQEDVIIYAEPSIGIVSAAAAAAAAEYEAPVTAAAALIPSVPSTAPSFRTGSSSSSNSYENDGDSNTHEYEECSDITAPSAPKNLSQETPLDGYEVMDDGNVDGGSEAGDGGAGGTGVRDTVA